MLLLTKPLVRYLSHCAHTRVRNIAECFGQVSYHSPNHYSPSKTVEPNELIVMDLPFTNDAQTVAHLMATRRGMERHQRIVITCGSVWFFALWRLLSPFSRTVDQLPRPQFSPRHFARLVRATGFEVTRREPLIFFPLLRGRFFEFFDRLLCGTPVVRHFCAAYITHLRPLQATAVLKRDLSLVIPLRNEKGNLAGILNDVRQLDDLLHEVIFVEGNSNDGTWDTLKEECSQYHGKVKLRLFQQLGVGKKDAVRLALSKAEADLIAIYDADRTVAAMNVRRFHDAYHQGQGDFINGGRLRLPMEKNAMRPLNWVGNHFFARLLSFALDLPLSDSLCGTKLFSRRHYEMMKRWNDRYPDFDPFGDFELLFPTAALGIGAKEIQVSYLARKYGDTNIHRFHDGYKLLKMSLYGIWYIRLGFPSPKAELVSASKSQRRAA